VFKSYAIFAAGLIGLSLVIFLAMQIIFSSSTDLLSNETIQKLVRTFTTAVAIIIVSVPEGLSLAVSIAMAFSISKMKEQQLLVKNMVASENLAYTNIICTGKTGTLTDGDMEVKEIFINGSYRPFLPGELVNEDNELGKIIKSCIILNNDAKIEMSYDAVYMPTGNKTEVAMLNFLYQNHVDVHRLLSER
jgi:magnesium-transporting ATPase (P-type)